MSTIAFTFTESEALSTLGGPLPEGIDPKEHKRLLYELEDKGLEKLEPSNLNIIRQVIEHQKSVSVDTPSPQPAQDAPSGVEPGKETGETENAPLGQPEATKAKPDSAEAKAKAKPEAKAEAEDGDEADEAEDEDEDKPEAEAEAEPEKTPRESLTEQVESLKKELKSAKRMLSIRQKVRMVSTDKETLKGLDTEMAKREAEIKDLETKLNEATERLLSLPPGVSPDEKQPWYKKIYANTTGYLVQNSLGDYQLTNETNTGRVLREMGISNRPDTPTTTPLDRVFNILHDKYHVDGYLALAGYRPGLIEQGGNKVLITKGPRLLTPVKGEWTTIQKFMRGLVRDQTKYLHAWKHLAVTPLYNGKINPGQSNPGHILVLAGPINSGKSFEQNHIITPLLGGRVARPYAYMVGRTDFNGDWFESEHLMCEDETPPRDYEMQQRFAAELKKLAADETHWWHGKGLQAATLAPYWRATVSVNNNPENLRAIPANDMTMKDKMAILEVYPDATVELVESLGGKENFSAAIKAELPAYLYWLLYEYQIPEELRDTRLGMVAYQNEEITKAVEKTTPYLDLLEVMEKHYAGANKLKKTGLEILSDLQNDPNTPKGVVPQKPITLGRYLTELTRITDAIERKETKRTTEYLLTFPGEPRNVISYQR